MNTAVAVVLGAVVGGAVYLSLPAGMPVLVKLVFVAAITAASGFVASRITGGR